jgi:hypothetical protein
VYLSPTRKSSSFGLAGADVRAAPVHPAHPLGHGHAGHGLRFWWCPDGGIINTIAPLTFGHWISPGRAAGILFGLAYPVLDPYMGVLLGWKAFVAAILGGRGSILGAALAGFLLGFHRNFCAHDFSVHPAGPDRLFHYPADTDIPAARLFRSSP